MGAAWSGVALFICCLLPLLCCCLATANRPPPWESLGRANELAVQQNAVAASRLPSARQNRIIALRD
jgi:uncharacterized MAPEG superfamily protein